MTKHVTNCDCISSRIIHAMCLSILCNHIGMWKTCESSQACATCSHCHGSSKLTEVLNHGTYLKLAYAFHRTIPNRTSGKFHERELAGTFEHIRTICNTRPPYASLDLVERCCFWQRHFHSWFFFPMVPLRSLQARASKATAWNGKDVRVVSCPEISEVSKPVWFFSTMS